MNARFTRDMEAAALMQLRAALSQGLDDAGCVAFATASLGKEHADLVRRVWDDMPKVMLGGRLMGQHFLLTGKISRQAACDVIWQAPAYASATIKPQKRSDEQNAKMWAMLSDISRAKPQGRKHVPEVWKCLFMAACGHQVAFELGLDGRPFPIGFSSSRLSKAEMMDLITFIQQWGDEQGVVWSNEAKA